MHFKQTLLPLLVCTTFAFSFSLNDLTKMATDTLENTKKSTSSSSSTSQENIIKGLKEALNQGVKTAVSSLGKENGYLNNESVKIPLPQSLQSAETIIRKAGYGNYADDLIKAINSAASSAVPGTASILSDTISKMSITDASSILNGSKTAATDYFKTHAFDKLQTLIAPLVKKSIDANQVANYYKAFNTAYKTYGKDLVEKTGVMSYAKSFGVDKFIPGNDEKSLDEYITAQTLDGLFSMIEKEEIAIRENPANRTTDLLQSIFK